MKRSPVSGRAIRDLLDGAETGLVHRQQQKRDGPLAVGELPSSWVTLQKAARNPTVLLLTPIFEECNGRFVVGASAQKLLGGRGPLAPIGVNSAEQVQVDGA